MRACPVCLSTFDDAVRFCPFHGVELKVLPENTVSVGESLNGYYLKEKIGEDGLGAVYRAEKGGNTYRLRCFSEAVLCDSGRSSRLNDVLELSMSLSGGAIPVADYGWNESGILYSAHPYIPGRSFRDVLKLGIALSEQDVAQMLLQLLRAVRDIHGQHVTHGNISLSNIIIDSSGRIRLHDAGFLGIFRDGHFEELRDDNPGVFGDVLDLMSPEVGRGEAACVYSDVYSCGASACCLMSGVSGPDDLAARMEAHLDGSIQEFWLRNLRRPVSQDFCDLLEASTLGSSSVRFQTARAFITALVSIHPELDESGDALSGGLVERLLDGAERVSAVDRRAVSRQTVLSGFDEAFDTIHEAASRESTRRGYDAERTVVEKTRFDGLTDIVGEALVETEIARQLERAVTTEMDPVEASPTVEFSEPAFAIRGEEAKSLDEEISSILNLAESLSKPEMTLEVGDALSSADTESEDHSESEAKDVESE
ncbi:MAG: serine/threonine protein kinase, partial [Bradymonadia bacterium]